MLGLYPSTKDKLEFHVLASVVIMRKLQLLSLSLLVINLDILLKLKNMLNQILNCVVVRRKIKFTNQLILEIN